MLFHHLHDPDAPGPLLVLSHGVGGHADLWTPFLTEAAAIRHLPVLAVDLAGHGRSAHRADYSIAAHARAVGEVIDHVLATHLTPEHPVIHLGHSMGGMIGLVDAANRSNVRAVLCCATKYQWLDRERAGLLRQAAKTRRLHATRDEALARHLTLTGLTGVLPTTSPCLAPGVEESDGGWQVTQDPGTYDIGEPAVALWVEAVPAPVRWAVGENDPLIGVDTLQSVRPHVFSGTGHNPHLERPDRLASWAFGQFDQIEAATAVH